MKLLFAIRVLALVLACASFGFALLGIPIPRVARIGRFALLGAVAAQLTIDIGHARSGRAPWTRVFFALIGCAASLEFALSGRPPVVLMLLVGLVELSIVAYVIVSVLRDRTARDDVDMPEDILAQRFAEFAPQALARFFAVESMIVVSSLRYLGGGFRTPRPLGFHYHDQSMYTPFLLAMPLFMIPELIAIDLMLWHAPIWWRLGSLAVHIYTLVWAYGLVALFRNRPHQLIGDRMVFRCGPFRRFVLPLASIASCSLVPPSITKSDFAKLAGKNPCLVLLGSPTVCVDLREPVEGIQRVFVSADDPSALMRALAA